MYRPCVVIIIVSRLSLWRGASARTSALKLLLLQIFVIDSIDDQITLSFILSDEVAKICYRIAGSARGQCGTNPVLWLAT